MTEDLLAFFEKWLNDHITPTEESLRAERAEGLAELFYRDAAEAGFDEDDVVEAASEITEGEDLVTFIEAKLDAATSDEDEIEDED